MPRIENSIFIQAPPAHVYGIARDVERFPDFMPEVQRITVLERSDDGRQVVEWVGIIPAFRLTVKWTEEDIWDDEARTCAFRQLSGDFSAYGGEWTFAQHDGGTQFTSVVNYELEIPTIGPLIRGVVKKIMHDNVARLQESLRRQAEGTLPREAGPA